MKTVLRSAAVTAAALLGVACADLGGPAGDVTGSLAAFESVPAGFSSTSNSFASEGDLGQAFHPRRGDGSFEERGGAGGHGGRGKGGHHGRPDGFGFLMGGGLGPDFFGILGYGPGKGRGPFRYDSVGSSCVFASSTGAVTCGPVTHRGLTTTVTATIKTAADVAQAKVDSLTNSIVLHSEVTGTVVRRDSATSVINHKSDRTVTGLSATSTQRTVAGTSIGTETTTGTTDAGAFQSIRTVNDTTTGITIPLVDGKPTWPSAGRVSRNMGVAITVAGVSTTHSRTEVVTYDGTATAKVVITQDGVAKNCTLPLPRGKMVCQ